MALAMDIMSSSSLCRCRQGGGVAVHHPVIVVVPLIVVIVPLVVVIVPLVVVVVPLIIIVMPLIVVAIAIALLLVVSSLSPSSPSGDGGA